MRNKHARRGCEDKKILFFFLGFWEKNLKMRKAWERERDLVFSIRENRKKKPFDSRNEIVSPIDVERISKDLRHRIVISSYQNRAW